MLDTRQLLKNTDFPAITRRKLEVLQANLGYLCNLSCTHCHVNAGPRRTELMTRETIEMLLQFLQTHGLRCLDVTGGAPELNPHFRYLVTEARRLGVEVIDRCNLTILLEPGQEDLAAFLAAQGVTVTASLPCYREDNVTQQRGKGVYRDSIEALQRLNALGYGSSPELTLNLVYNPNGSFLPPPQEQLQADYKRELGQRYGIVFDQLLTITNMPISRFGSTLISKGEYSNYMNLLKNNYSEQNLASVMCRSLLSVDWQGYVYDCDFNQMLGWPLPLTAGCVPGNPGAEALIGSDRDKVHLRELLDRDLSGAAITVGDHCYGCTAGQGSSCGGALEGGL